MDWNFDFFKGGGGVDSYSLLISSSYHGHFRQKQSATPATAPPITAKEASTLTMTTTFPSAALSFLALCTLSLSVVGDVLIPASVESFVIMSVSGNDDVRFAGVVVSGNAFVVAAEVGLSLECAAGVVVFGNAFVVAAEVGLSLEGAAGVVVCGNIVVVVLLLLAVVE